MKERRHFPTPGEIRAIELAARRARDEELRRLFSVATQKLGALIARGAAAAAGRFRRAGNPARHGA